jgi:hypothetical protein
MVTDPALEAHLDVLRVREASVPTVLRLTDDDEARAAAQDLTRHFDADGLVLLRKSLIARLEPLMTADVAAGAWRGRIQRVFRQWMRDPRAVVAPQERWLLAALWLLVLLRTAAVLVTRGWTSSASGRRFTVGVPNKWGPPAAGRVHHDLLLIDARLTPADVVILAENDRYLQEYRRRGIAVVDVRRARPVRHVWLTDVWPRMRTLAAARLRRGPRSSAGWLASFAAWEVAWRSIDWECLFSAIRVDVVADVEEQNALHAIKTCVVGRRGGRTLRLPHTQPDTPGSHTAFWMYHVIAVSSEYLHREYGATWWPAARIVPVGLIFNAPSADSGAAWLETVRARGPVLALFTGSEVGLQRRIHDELAAVVARILATRPETQLVIKPKPSHTRFISEGAFHEALLPFVQRGRVTVMDPQSNWCSAQDLLRAATVSLTYGGSVVAEALALGAPMVVYPVVPAHETGWVRAVRDRVIFESSERVVSHVAELLDRGGREMVDDAIRAVYCDPFRDGRALERLTDLCLNLRKAA